MKIIKAETEKKRVEGTEKERNTERGKRSVRKRKRRGSKSTRAQKVRFLQGGVSRRNGSMDGLPRLEP